MLIIIVPTIIGQILAIILFYDRHCYNVSYYTSSVIANEIVLLTENYKQNPKKSTLTAVDYLNLSYKFTDNKNISQKQQPIPEELQIFQDVLDAKLKKKNIVKLGNEGKIEVLVELGSGVMEIWLASKILINPTTYIFVFWIIFLTIILLSVSLILLKNQIRSILDLTSMANAFSMGQKNISNFKPAGASEIRMAGIAILKMKERIEKQSSNRAQMLAMISHDLRTPLTRMKLQVELMEDSDDKNDLQQDLDSMKQMIDTYLDFARGEGGEEFQTIKINGFLQNFIKTKWSNSNIEIALNIDTKSSCAKIKPLSFERAISNLLSNALRYGNRARITLSKINDALQIDVEDNGSGIKDADKDLVFKAFYRSDKSRKLSHLGNVGLGLTIVKEIIIAHFGKIHLLDSKDLGGLLVRITLPVHYP